MKDIYFCRHCENVIDFWKGGRAGKYCSQKCEHDFKVMERMKSNPSKDTALTYMKRFVELRCSECKIVDWNGKPLRFQMDHVDGNTFNNDVSNLRWLCPNCHTQTPTWGVKNVSEQGRQRMNEGGIRGNSIRNKKK